ncbi:MAG: DUF3870 domain-containing protein [Acidaminococcus sp.]|uniref:DUF3870 domain-containing protein n=1 Tax=Acidaminococcus sp. TaxID=1872103 RepID=UPI003F189EB0
MREIVYPEDSVFVTGVAKVSKEDAINAMYGTFSLSLIIDPHTGIILDANANMIMQETNTFIKDILVGRNLLTEVEPMTQILKKRFLALSQRAVIAALKDAQNHFLLVYPRAR